eukprot:scaffold675575_cov169-Prasinocladus_malaysianus.AAC.1
MDGNVRIGRLSLFFVDKPDIEFVAYMTCKSATQANNFAADHKVSVEDLRAFPSKEAAANENNSGVAFADIFDQSVASHLPISGFPFDSTCG